MRIGIIIPGYNEAARIGTVLQDLCMLAERLTHHLFLVVVVDDGSSDNTAGVARRHAKRFPDKMSLFVLRHQTNLGKGAAAITGCEAARKLGAHVIALMDADGQHRAEDLTKLLLAHEKLQRPALIIGARERTQDMPFTMRFGNSVLTGLARALFDIRVRDSQSGLRVFSAELYPQVRWSSPHYSMETEMLIMARVSGVHMVEVPIATVYHDNHKGTTPLDGLRVVRTLFEWRVFRSPGRHLASTLQEDLFSHDFSA